MNPVKRTRLRKDKKSAQGFELKKFNHLAWRDVRALSEKNKVSVGVAKNVWWQQACRNAYSRLREPVLFKKEEYVKL